MHADTPPDPHSVAPGAERRVQSATPGDGLRQFRRLDDAQDLLGSLHQRRATPEFAAAVSPSALEEPRGRTNLSEMLRSNESLVARIQDAVAATLRVHSRSRVAVMPVRSAGLPGQADVAIIGVLRLTSCLNCSSMLALGLSRTAFAGIYENMFGEPLTELTEENVDLAGELVNIVFQTIDPDLRELGIELEPALPAFLTGRAIDGWSLAAVGHSFVLPFSTDAGDLFIAIPDPAVGASAVSLHDSSSLAERP